MRPMMPNPNTLDFPKLRQIITAAENEEHAAQQAEAAPPTVFKCPLCPWREGFARIGDLTRHTNSKGRNVPSDDQRAHLDRSEQFKKGAHVSAAPSARLAPHAVDPTTPSTQHGATPPRHPHRLPA
jgi:hypothetical protein